MRLRGVQRSGRVGQAGTPVNLLARIVAKGDVIVSSPTAAVLGVLPALVK